MRLPSHKTIPIQTELLWCAHVVCQSCKCLLSSLTVRSSDSSAHSRQHLPPSRIYQSPTQDLYPRSPVRHSDSSSWKAYQSGNHEPYKPKPLTSGHLKSESNTKIRQETDKNGPIDLSCIDGIKPIQRLNEGRSIFGKTFKITRKGGEYFCTCKQWKEAKARGIATCKHLRNAFGGRYETSRIMRMKKNGAMLPSGIGSHSPLETIVSDPKPPDTVADVQMVDDKTVSNAIDSDRISDGTHDPNSLIADSARNLSAESIASLKLKDITLSKQSENAVEINKLTDDSSDLESKPASIKPPEPRAKKADPQMPRAKSAEFDSTTSSDMTDDFKQANTRFGWR
ncbi:hypothetical protein BJ741DRAFT_58085 [Chytriomyces cf. hyalinus JEL632]|nr:hypothetical protein BJ741DRAFT_58085 [Chytriomyces cf. hyalinus JEL632]